VRARRSDTWEAKASRFGFCDVTWSASSGLVGTVPVPREIVTSFSSEFRHWTSSAAFACFSASPVSGMVHASPPNGETTVPPAVGAGIGTMP